MIMAHVLAQINWEQAGIFATALIAALGGQKGLQALISARQRRNAKTNRGFCAVHHEFAEKLDERHEALLSAIKDVKTAINRVHERIDIIANRKE